VWEEFGEIQVWDVTDGRAVRTLRGHNHLITGLAFSPDGARLASAGYDHSVKLWDPSTGQQLRSLPGQRRFLSAAFSPDGTRLATGCQDNPLTHEFTLKIWDARPATDELRTEREARTLLDYLFARPLCRADVCDYLRDHAALDPAAREKALVLAERYPDETNPEMHYQASWAVLCRPHLNAVQYRFALSQANAACRLRPGQTRYQVSFAAGQYRTANYKQAQATLGKAGPLTPAGMAFLAMTQQRLGESEQARATLTRLLEAISKHNGEKDEATVSLWHEAESLLAGSVTAPIQ
jgi:hypothetical protein